MKIMLQLNREELNNLQYPIVVEQWDKVKGSMSKRRKYNEQFTEQERNTIRRYYPIFYSWYLKTGTPDNHTMKPEILKVLERAINFFATI